MAHYLVAANPLPGHVLPMLQIGADLRRRGASVTMLTSADHRDAVTARGMRLQPLARDGVLTPPSTGRWLPGLVRRSVIGRQEMRSVFIAPLAAQYAALRRVLEHSRVDAVLVDLAFTGVLPLLLGGRPRPPVLVFGVGPLTLSSVDTPPFGAAWQPWAGMNYTSMTWAVHRLLIADIQAELDAALRSVGSPPAPVALTDWPRMADRLLQLTVPRFEYPRRDLPANVEFIGPVLPEPDGAAPTLPEWWQRLQAARTVVHVTQGTHDNADLDRLVGPTLRAFADDPDTVVVATTGRRDGQRLRTGVAANAIVTDWFPYHLLLRQVDVMVTNGGYGGVHHALRQGIPLVVAGETSDKAEVAARVAYSGVGVNLRTARPSPAVIAAAVRRIRADDGYRAAARAIAGDIAKYAPLDAVAKVLTEEVNAA